jgi:hypothetical protein
MQHGLPVLDIFSFNFPPTPKTKVQDVKTEMKVTAQDLGHRTPATPLRWKRGPSLHSRCACPAGQFQLLIVVGNVSHSLYEQELLGVLHDS